MNVEDRIRRALHDAAHRVQPTETAWESIRGMASGRRRRRNFERLAAAFVAVAVVSGATIYGFRALGDRSQGPGVSLTQPPPSGPLSGLSPLPSSPGTPASTQTVESPSPSEDFDMKTFVSPDGTWEIKYPSDWSVDENNQAPNKWWLFHSNPDLAPAETELRDGEYSIEFRIEANTKNETVEDLLARYCEVPPDIEGQIEECRKATIIGRTWAWALLHETTFGGVNNYAVGTIAEGRVYESFAHVPDGEHSKAGLEQVREILATFKIEG